MSEVFSAARRSISIVAAASALLLTTATQAFDEPLTEEDRQVIRKSYIDLVVAELLEPTPFLEGEAVARCFQWNNIQVMVAPPPPGSGDEIRERLNQFPELDYETMEWDLQGNPRFRRFGGASGRWSSTANGTVTLRNPFTLTYSFVPDGTTIPNGVGEGSGTSSLIALMNANFGAQATWETLFEITFDMWATWTVITYVKVNDDGVAMFTNAGTGTTRGDVRVGMKNIDGSGGSFDILAYNFSPDNGDMVMDASNISFFANPSSSYRRFKNVVAHEHGHGLGFAHVDPVNQTKLMEPTVSVAYTGPQYDDHRGVMYNYGDRHEANNSTGTATSLGPLNDSQTILLSNIVAIETSSAVDVYSVDLPANSNLSVTVAPRLGSYQEGPQNGTVTTLDAGIVQNLQFAIIDTNGSTTLTTVNNTAAGSSESVSMFPLTNAGTYFVRVSSAGGSDAPQVYSLTLQNTVTVLSTEDWEVLD